MRRYTGQPVLHPHAPRELPDREVPWFDLRLVLETYRTNEEFREENEMDANVKNLAGTVREAMLALSNVPYAASRLKEAALRVAGRVDQVNAMTNDLEAADAMLANVVGAATAPASGSNQPPLDSSPTSSASSPPSPTPSSPPPAAATQPLSDQPMTAAQGARVVEAANAVVTP